MTLKIIATVLLGMSLMTLPIKHIVFFSDTRHERTNIVLSLLWSIAWRVFVIVVLWIV